MEFLEWGPRVLKTRLPLDLVDELVLKADKVSPANHNLAGHLKDQWYFNDQCTLWFKEKIESTFNDYCLLKFSLTELWINHMIAGDFNPPHSHVGDYSFILFANTLIDLHKDIISHQAVSAHPGSISFTYGDPANKQVETQHNFIPTKGDFFIFPSNTVHYVTPFRCKGTRISISGNIVIEKE